MITPQAIPTQSLPTAAAVAAAAATAKIHALDTVIPNLGMNPTELLGKKLIFCIALSSSFKQLWFLSTPPIKRKKNSFFLSSAIFFFFVG